MQRLGQPQIAIGLPFESTSGTSGIDRAVLLRSRCAVHAATAASTTSSIAACWPAAADTFSRPIPTAARALRRSTIPAHDFFDVEAGRPMSRVNESSGCTYHTGDGASGSHRATSKIFARRAYDCRLTPLPVSCTESFVASA